MKTIVLASSNKGKIKEFKEILNNYNILGLEDINYNKEIVEDGTTFFENAYIKAHTIHNYLKSQNLDYIVISDDSGICVDALNGAPGIFSARYASEHNDALNRAKLLNELKGKDRQAHFECDIVLFYPNGEYKTFVGKCFGSITEEEIGNKDFAYDCVFYSDDLKKTFGEVSKEEKNSVSHRGRAIEKLLEELN